MGNHRKSYGYDFDEAERLSGIVLPEKIKCGRCLKNISRAKFSTKQLTDARRQINECGRIKKPINCHHCTGQQVVELECFMCNKTKGTEEFSKVQRSKPDTAKCFKCMEVQVKESAINEEKYENPHSAFLPPDHSAGIYPDYFSSTTSTADAASTYGEDEWNMVNNDRGNNRKTKTRDDDSGGGVILPDLASMSLDNSHKSEHGSSAAEVFSYGHGYGQWTKASTKSWHTESVGPTSPSSRSTFGKHVDSSATSVTGSSCSFASSQAERSSAARGRSTAWTKKSEIPLGTPNHSAYHGGPMRPMGDATHERESVVNAWDSDEEEGEGGDNDYDSDDDTQI